MDVATDERVSVWEATVRLAAVMAKDGADKVAELLPSVQTRVNLDAVKELGFLLFHEAEKKKDEGRDPLQRPGERLGRRERAGTRSPRRRGPRNRSSTSTRTRD